MTTKEPTQEQRKEFWEWCGLTLQEDDTTFTEWRDTKGELVCCGHSGFIPDIDLNNLFKYAVPKLEWVEIVWQNTPKNYCQVTIRGYTGRSKEFATRKYSQKAETPALSLCLAIEKLIDGE